MGEVPGDRKPVGETDISFRVVVSIPGQTRFSYKYGPYTGWFHAIFDCGLVVGFARGRGTPIEFISVEWFIGDKLIETKDLDHEPGEEGTGQGTSSDSSRGQVP